MVLKTVSCPVAISKIARQLGNREDDSYALSTVEVSCVAISGMSLGGWNDHGELLFLHSGEFDSDPKTEYATTVMFNYRDCGGPNTSEYAIFRPYATWRHYDGKSIPISDCFLAPTVFDVSSSSIVAWGDSALYRSLSLIRSSKRVSDTILNILNTLE